MNHRSAYEFVYRFLSAPALLEAIPELGPFHAQARVRGAGLGRTLGSVSPIAMPGLDFACDPDAGLAFSTPLLKSVRAGLAARQSRIGDVFEFEFDSFPGALSLHKFPTMEQATAVLEAVGEFPGSLLDEVRLAEWRASLPVLGPLCPCCREKADSRCENPKRFPLYQILNHALDFRVPLDFRVTSDVVDLATRFVPWEVKPRQACLVVTDELAESACHLDLRYVHSLTIRKVYLEGAWFSSLRVWNVYGEPQLQLLAEDGALASHWADLCEGRVGGPYNC